MAMAAPRAPGKNPGDRERVLEEWVEAYGDSILQLAYFYVKDRDLAEDIFQETFIRAYTQMARFRGESSPRTWIYRIAINLCRDRLRSWAFRKVLFLGEELLGGMVSAAPDTEDEVLAVVDRADLLERIMQLPVEYREAVLLYYYEEMDTREVAEALGLSEGTVRSRLHRARAKLRSMLTEGGLADVRS